MPTPANALDITAAGLVKFDGSTTFSGVTTTNHATLVGDATNGITSVGPSATAGQVFQSGGASANPSYSTATYPSTSGTSGKVLVSDGTNFVSSTATFPSTAGATGTILRSDGTNWVATTSTYPDTNAVSTLVYASASNVLGALATATNGLLVTSNTGVPSVLAGPGATGKVLQSNTAAAPSYSTATYPSTSGTSGKVLISDGTNIVSSTPTYPNASVTAGKVIVSDGTNYIASTPTFPNASATSGKFIRSDGTNWIASTPTLPTAAGTTGKVLQSNGTNYVESTPTYPSASGSSGKILISDGTNNVYSTPTFPNASATSGKFIRSDGTNWIASTPTLPTTGGTASTLLRSDGTNWVNTSAFKVSSSDIVTNTAQPMICASQATSQANATGDGTSFDIIFDQILTQNGSNFSTVTGKYTCPVSGFYQVSYVVTFTGITSAMNDGYHQLLSSAGTVLRNSWNAAAARTAANEISCNAAVINYFNASDTIYVNVNISNGAKVASTKQNFFGNFCYFSVQLVG